MGVTASHDRSDLDLTRVNARRRVRGPAIALLLVSVFMFLTSALGLYVSFGSDRDWSHDLWSYLRTWSDRPAWQDWVQTHLDEHAQPGRDRSIERLLMGIVTVARIAIYLVVFWAGLNALALRRYGLCITGTILTLIFNGALCAGLPVGIWALWILSQADVRGAFDMPMPGRQVP